MRTRKTETPRPGWDRTDPAEWSPAPTRAQVDAFDAYAAARMAHPSWPGGTYPGTLAPVDVSARPRRVRLTRRGEIVLIAAAAAVALVVLAAVPTGASLTANQAAARDALTVARSTGSDGYGSSLPVAPTGATCAGTATGHPVCIMMAHGYPVALATGTRTGTLYAFTFAPVPS